MFLDWIAQLHLLQHDAQTNILNVLPVSTRRTLIAEITSYLHPAAGKPAPPPSIFSSPAHVKWFMEVIGQGFNLPLEDMAITSEDINIYAQWLFEANQRPTAVSREGLEQEFFQIIFHQYSLIFRPRVPRQSSGSKSTVYTTSALIPAPGATSLMAVPMAQPSPGTSKETAAQLSQRHIELCKKVLTVFTMAGRTLDLSEETWSVLLKVVLGITDSLLSERPNSDSHRTGLSMGDELCEHLLRVLFELWLRSKTRDVEMWDIMKRCFVRWTHRPKAIQQWSSIALSLTNRTLRFLYGPTAGSPIVSIVVNGFNVKLDLPQDFVYYAWHRMLFLIPNPWQLSPGNFALAIMGVGKIVEAFHSVGQPSTPVAESLSPPDGNTLLHIFGGWLFDACFSAPQLSTEYQQGRAEAYGILCRIFSKPQRREPFLRLYIERFYAALAIGLRSETCLPTILTNSTELFATDLEGVRLMVPDFVVGIKSILPSIQPEFRNVVVSVDELRLAAIKVTSTIMSLPNHFENVTLKPDWDRGLNVASDSPTMAGEQEKLVSQLMKVLYAQQSTTQPAFTSLKYYILELLLMSLRTETSSYNMRYLLHLINVYVVEDVPFCPGLVGTVVKLIQEKILTMQLGSDVTLVAFDVLMDFVGLYEYVKRDSKNVARELVLALCRYADTLTSTGNLAHKYPLVVQAYDCMMRWVMVGQWIVDDRDCQFAVVATLSKGITIFEREPEITSQIDGSQEKKKRRDNAFPPTKQLFQLPNRANKSASGSQITDPEKIASTQNRNGMGMHKKEEVAVKMAAEYCMSQFVNQLGNFPPWKDHVGPTRTSTLLDDLEILKSWRQKRDNAAHEGEIVEPIRFFLLDGRVVIGLMDIKGDGNEDDAKELCKAPGLVLICRDTTGKYSWTTQLRYEDLTNKLSPSTSRSLSTSSSIVQENQSPYTQTDSGSNAESGVNASKSDVSIPTVEAVNWMALPSLEQLLQEKPDRKAEVEQLKIITATQQLAEEGSQHENSRVIPKVKPDGGDINIEKRPGHRLFMSHLGFLHNKNRRSIVPLKTTDSLISELETLDLLNERDCISISTYFAQSGNVTESELVEQPAVMNEDYLRFLYTLGWPVKLSEHNGYRGKLDPAVCDVIPYFADRMVEVIFHSPYFLHTPNQDDLTWGSISRVNKLHQQITLDDHVCIIWIEDMTNWESLVQRIKGINAPNAKSMVYIFINPLPGAVDGLYWIRIMIPSAGNHPAASQRLKDNALIVGPLVDGMIVSRHALGAMVRNTAISAHQACRVVTDSFTRPYVIRKHFIEELAHRHSAKMSLSKFYSDLFYQG
ncbi:hypothetical protein VKS41_000701 [Umbelopsis sp. WA50703]